jgi:hypothetical protein
VGKKVVMLMKEKFFIFVVCILCFIHCDKGLSPPDTPQEKSGISGTVYFQNWPPLDSLFDIRVVIFQEYPPQNIVGEIISGRAFLYPSLNDTFRIPFNIDSLFYAIELEPATYEYLVVAHQFGTDLYNDWQVVGQYDNTPQDSLPTTIHLDEGQLLTDLNIWVDFDNLPPQPF